MMKRPVKHVIYTLCLRCISVEKGETGAPCKEGGVCVDNFAECVRGRCHCMEDYFLKNENCGTV